MADVKNVISSVTPLYCSNNSSRAIESFVRHPLRYADPKRDECLVDCWHRRAQPPDLTGCLPTVRSPSRTRSTTIRTGWLRRIGDASGSTYPSEVTGYEQVVRLGGDMQANHGTSSDSSATVVDSLVLSCQPCRESVCASWFTPYRQIQGRVTRAKVVGKHRPTVNVLTQSAGPPMGLTAPTLGTPSFSPELLLRGANIPCGKKTGSVLRFYQLHGTLL